MPLMWRSWVSARRAITLSFVALVPLLSLVCDRQPAGKSGIMEHSGWDWPRVSPGEFGTDEARLRAMIRSISSGEPPNIHSVLVLKGGKMALEEYFHGHHEREAHEIRSATKVIGSLLTGIAIDHGFIPSEREPIRKYLESDYEPSYGWNPRSRLVEIRHLLSMMSGYDCDDLGSAFACEHGMYDTDDWVQYALDLPLVHEPGEHWAYNSSSLILVGEAIARGSAMPLEKFAAQYLLEPMGITSMRWAVSPQGRPWIGGGARMTSRDMARIGQMMLDRGTWNGRRIVSEAWLETSTARQGDMNNGVDYGYAWQRGEALLGMRLVPAYWASGNGGQYIIVLPEDDMVVVFTGGNYDDPLSDRPFRILVQDILPAFLGVTPPPEVTLAREDFHRLAGTFELDFEPEVTTTVSVNQGGLRALTPNHETVELVAHSSTMLSGDSQYGHLTFVFEKDGHDEITAFKVYSNFTRFTFERRRSP